MRWALSPGSVSLMGASSIELSISAFGEVDVVQLAYNGAVEAVQDRGETGLAGGDRELRHVRELQ